MYTPWRWREAGLASATDKQSYNKPDVLQAYAQFAQTRALETVTAANSDISTELAMQIYTLR